jgi:hypothetical protein
LTTMNGRLFGLVSPFSPDTRFVGDKMSQAVPATTVVQRLP